MGLREKYGTILSNNVIQHIGCVDLVSLAKVGVEGSIPFARSNFFNHLATIDIEPKLACVSYSVS